MSKTTLHNKDVFQRSNFLQQASLLIADKNPTLSCYYGNLFKQINKKSVLKIDSSLKRNLCKRCCIYFTPSTSEIRATDSVALVKCSKCGFEKKYPVNDHYELGREPGDVIEVT